MLRHRHDPSGSTMIATMRAVASASPEQVSASRDRLPCAAALDMERSTRHLPVSVRVTRATATTLRSGGMGGPARSLNA
jgi:hypothetical protein